MKSNLKLPTRMSEDLALLYGVLLGDGCLSKTGKGYFVVVSGNRIDDLSFFEYLLPFFNKLRGKDCKIRYKKDQNSIEINFSDKRLFNLFKKIGMPIGKKGTSLSISNSFDNNFYASLVKGYFATDGCLVITNNNGIVYPRIEFSSISKSILQQVLNYLISLDLNGKLYVSHKSKGTWNTLYRIQFNGKRNLELFRSKIGFVNSKHMNKYKKWKKNAGGAI
ncbi:hypothetical protein KY331_03475 [Candidatus Woesearchaeota archaeon]|nr:hypothetical protein [Candidatus Woesearchaeota archaeon]